jgi:hypothetical protein
MSIQGGVNCIVDVSAAWIRFLMECLIPVSNQLPIADAGPPGSAWDVCWGSEDVQAVQADGLTIHSHSRQPGGNRLSGRDGTMNTGQLRQACDRCGQLIQIARRPHPIEDHGVAAIGTHGNGGTVPGCSAPAFGLGCVKSQTDGPEHRRSDRIGF